MTPLPGIDPNQKNLTAGSYAKYGNGGGVETYALARVESDANNPAIFRVTTASYGCGDGDWGAGGDLVAVAAVIAVRGRTRVPG